MPNKITYKPSDKQTPALDTQVPQPPGPGPQLRCHTGVFPSSQHSQSGLNVETMTTFYVNVCLLNKFREKKNVAPS